MNIPNLGTKHKQTRYQMFTNISERTRPLFMFVSSAKRMKFLSRICLFIKQTNTNELSTKQFLKCSLIV
ncbi:hypothetical protein Hanom_Chr09g00778551 [Helianthus anomalus]